jgi:SAM-dependent methyltransferase
MGVQETARRLWRDRVPETVRERVNRTRASRRERAWRKPRDLGDLRRLEPFSTWGSSRGGPIDRIYINQFIQRHAGDVRGRALEVMNDHYLRRYGTGVTQVDVLDLDETNEQATFYGDIADAPDVPDDTFDCVVLTQVLPLVYDPRAALRTAYRILGPGGVLLATTGGISRIAPLEAPVYGHWWHFTSMSARRLAEEVFGEGNVEVEAYGNVLAAAGFLFGLGRYDLSEEEIAQRDPGYEVTIGIRAVKRAP